MPGAGSPQPMRLDCCLHPSFALGDLGQTGDIYMPRKSEMLPIVAPPPPQELVVKYLLALHWEKGRIFSFFRKKNVRFFFKIVG